MRLLEKKELLEYWEHTSHQITLVLVAISLLAGLATRWIPSAGGAEGRLDHLLHATHLVALILALVYGSLVLLFSRNVGKQIAESLNEAPLPADRPEHSAVAGEKKYDYQALTVSDGDVQFVDKPTGEVAEALFAMNREIWEGSTFEMDDEHIRKRNTALIEKNPKLFMLVRNPLREVENRNPADGFIGYTCIIPLNETGADCYLHGIIRDRDLRASLVCQPAESCGALLVFAIGLRKSYQKSRGLRAQYYPFLLRCAEHHVNVMAAATTPGDGATVWAGSEHPQLRQHFTGLGFACNSEKKSADGLVLYSRPMPRPTQELKASA